MSRKVAYLSRLPASAELWTRWGIGVLQKRGIQVEFVDCSEIIATTGDRGFPPPTTLQCESIKINTLAELDRYIRSRRSETIFFDTFNGFSEYGPRLGEIFKTLKKHDARFYVVHDGLLPGPLSALPMGARFRYRLAQATNLRKLTDYLVRRMVVALAKRRIGYAVPFRIFALPNADVNNFLRKMRLCPSVLTPVNARDYDKYLQVTKSATAGSPENGICVFLDEAATHHPDFGIFGLKPLTPGNYFDGMNGFFSHIEKMTGLEVVVAAHPKANYREAENPFVGRRIIFGSTAELVSQSSAVIAHASTSISFGVLFRKPIVLVVTDEMKSNFMGRLVDAFARELGVTPLNVDSSEEVGKLTLDLSLRPSYENYLNKYVRSAAAEDLPLWEIVARAVEAEVNLA